jgi:hypothetical protein
MDERELRLAALSAFFELPLANKDDTLAALQRVHWLVENYLFADRLPLADGNSCSSSATS